MKNPYAFHGVHCEDIGTQYCADCPFCGKPGHFFVSDPDKHDCKPPKVPWGFACHGCGLEGNIYTFLSELTTRNTLTDEAAADLHNRRGITPETARLHGIFTTPGTKYNLPSWNLEGRLSNVYRVIWDPNKRREIVASTPGCQHHLYLGHLLSRERRKPIWVCEGHWDTLLLKQTMPKADICGTPGTVFKDNWAYPFRQRTAYLCFDNDDAGRRHHEKTASKLPKTKTFFLDWGLCANPVPEKFDVSDLILQVGPTKALTQIRSQLKKSPIRARHIGGRLAGIEFHPVPVSRLSEVTEPVDWIWEGYIARRCSTALIAVQKSGKTTLLTEILRLLATGGELQTPITKCDALVITEEDRALWSSRTREVGLSDNVHVVSRPCKGTPNKAMWEDLVHNHIIPYCNANDIGLVIFDTWARLSPVDDENDAVKCRDALEPLDRMFDENLAVILVHHSKKGEAAEGHAARGSTFLAGAVDIIIEFRRRRKEDPDNTQRVLRTYSRFQESPPQITLERLANGHYKSLGSRKQLNSQVRQSIIEAILDEKGQLTKEDLVSKGDMTDRTAGSELKKAVETGKLTRTGKGTKGDPYRYHKTED